MQLRELARLNGTLREDDNRCVCGAMGCSAHKNDSTKGGFRERFKLYVESGAEDCFLVFPCRILRPWQNSEPRSITNTTLCTKCGGAGHISSDCKYTR